MKRWIEIAFEPEMKSRSVEPLRELALLIIA
jgi:hypothetical protein